MLKIKLCVNIDHVATLREARGGVEPDICKAAKICEESGCAGITVHLREDRRHIQDNDVVILRDIVKGKFNLEMALAEDVVKVALNVKPDMVTIVPEKREELTTEGGLNLIDNENRIKDVIDRFKIKNIDVSLFIEPDIDKVLLSKKLGANFIEIHTGEYSNANSDKDRERELNRILKAAKYAKEIGIRINAGHGLNYLNTESVLDCDGLEELNIGHSIISRSVFVGLSQAVKEMIQIIKKKGI